MRDPDVPGLTLGVRLRVYDHVFGNDDREVGGVLVGRLGTGDLPIVTGAIEALEADEQRASVTFTHETWASIHTALDQDFPGDQIVGWYHSHPGFGIFLSTYDQFIHSNFFGDSRQIAYVVDPHAGTEGVFQWQDGELVAIWEGESARPGTRTARHRDPDGGALSGAEPVSPLGFDTRRRRGGAAIDSQAFTRLIPMCVVAILFVVLIVTIVATS